MLQSAKNAIRAKVAALAVRLGEVLDRAEAGLRAAALGLVPVPAPVPVRVRARRPDRQV